MSKVALSEVEKKILGQKPDSKSFDLAAYVGGKFREDLVDEEKSKLTYVGLTVPTTKQIFKEGFSFAKMRVDKPKDQEEEINSNQFKIWNFIFNQSEIFEVKSLALMHFRNLPEDFLIKELQDVRRLVDKVDNWAHSDELSHIYARLLEHSPKTIWPLLKDWNKSDNLWHRRQSLVGMLNYASQRKSVPQTTHMLKMIQNLLEDSSFYVQRGVGWSLREVYNVDPKAQVEFVKKHLMKISAIAWSAAGEKYPLALRKQLVESRKTGRRRA